MGFVYCFSELPFEFYKEKMKIAGKIVSLVLLLFATVSCTDQSDKIIGAWELDRDATMKANHSGYDWTELPAVSSYTFEEDGIYYGIQDEEVRVAGYWKLEEYKDFQGHVKPEDVLPFLHPYFNGSNLPGNILSLDRRIYNEEWSVVPRPIHKLVLGVEEDKLILFSESILVFKRTQPQPRPDWADPAKLSVVRKDSLSFEEFDGLYEYRGWPYHPKRFHPDEMGKVDSSFQLPAWTARQWIEIINTGGQTFESLELFPENKSTTNLDLDASRLDSLRYPSGILYLRSEHRVIAPTYDKPMERTFVLSQTCRYQKDVFGLYSLDCDTMAGEVSRWGGVTLPLGQIIFVYRFHKNDDFVWGREEFGMSLGLRKAAQDSSEYLLQGRNRREKVNFEQGGNPRVTINFPGGSHEINESEKAKLLHFLKLNTRILNLVKYGVEGAPKLQVAGFEVGGGVDSFLGLKVDDQTVITELRMIAICKYVNSFEPKIHPEEDFRFFFNEKGTAPYDADSTVNLGNTILVEFIPAS
jgi:hypothetical protein